MYFYITYNPPPCTPTYVLLYNQQPTSMHPHTRACISRTAHPMHPHICTFIEPTTHPHAPNPTYVLAFNVKLTMHVRSRCCCASGMAAAASVVSWPASTPTSSSRPQSSWGRYCCVVTATCSSHSDSAELRRSADCTAACGVCVCVCVCVCACCVCTSANVFVSRKMPHQVGTAILMNGTRYICTFSERSPVNAV